MGLNLAKGSDPMTASLKVYSHMSQLSPVSVIGDNADPYSGRIWYRQFPHGDFELLYKSHAKGPSECERINAWLHDSGSDNRVTPASFGRSVSVSQVDADGVITEPKETNPERVQRRAKQKVRWNLKCIGADRLLTLTFRDNVTDYSQAEKCLTKFLRLCRDEWGQSFRFCAVPELQKRGAWHFHLALRGFWNINKLRVFWWRSLGSKVAFSEGGKPVLLDDSVTRGNVDITNPRVRGQVRRNWSVDRLASYLAKYVGKAIAENDLGGKPSYRCTRGLKPDLQRFLVRALSYADVLKQFFASAPPSDRSPFLFASPDRQVLWAAGHTSLELLPSP